MAMSSKASAVPSVGGAAALPQLSTVRTLEALAAGGAELPQQSYTSRPCPSVMCKFFLRNACQKGRSCSFSHEVEALPDVPLDEKLRSACQYYSRGQCARGKSCKFAHGLEELEQVLSIKPTKKRRGHAADVEPTERQEISPVSSAVDTFLSAASGFQIFEQFNPSSARVTQVEALAVKVNEKKAQLEADSQAANDDWMSFLAEVGGESGESGEGDGGNGSSGADILADGAARGGANGSDSAGDATDVRSSLGGVVGPRPPGLIPGSGGANSQTSGPGSGGANSQTSGQSQDTFGTWGGGGSCSSSCQGVGQSQEAFGARAGGGSGSNFCQGGGVDSWDQWADEFAIRSDGGAKVVQETLVYDDACSGSFGGTGWKGCTGTSWDAWGGPSCGGKGSEQLRGSAWPGGAETSAQDAVVLGGGTFSNGQHFSSFGWGGKQ